MVETPGTDRGDVTANDSSGETRASEVKAWFVREVLPLEAVLIQFLSHGGRNRADVEDLRQDVYMRVCASAFKEIPNPTRPLVFTVARNLLIDRVRREQVIPIEAVENLDVLNVAIDTPSADRVLVAREELRTLRDALGRLPDRVHAAVTMHKIDGLTVREIAERIGVTERTTERYLSEGLRILAETVLREPRDPRRSS